MEKLLRNGYPVIVLGFLTVLALLAAGIVTEYLTARFLTPAEPAFEPGLARTASTLRRARSLHGRDPFNVDPSARPPTRPAGTEAPPPVTPPVLPPDTRTALNVQLQGTLVNAAEPDQRFAAIIAEGESEIVAIGSDVLGRATVVDIQPRLLTLQEGTRLTQVGLWDARPAAAPRPVRTTAEARQARPRAAGVTAPSPYATFVARESPTRFRIDRRALDPTLRDLSSLAGQARVVPIFRGRQQEGFRLTAVQRGSLYEALGLRSGDVLRAVNGRGLDSPNTALELFHQLKHAPTLHLGIERGGLPKTLHYVFQ